MSERPTRGDADETTIDEVTGPTGGERAEEIWDDESPAQGPRLRSADGGTPPGTADDPSREPDAWAGD